MNDQSLKILKLIGLAIAGFGLLLILLSPFIGEALTRGSLWWIEPVAYIGSGVFVLGAVVAFIGFQIIDRRTKSLMGDRTRTWSQVTQDYFDTFAHDMGRPLRRILGKQREARALLNETGEVSTNMVSELLDEIENQAPNFRLMIENVRVLVDLEDHTAATAVDPVDAAAIVRNVSDRYTPIARERGLELVWWCEPSEFGLIYGDGSALDHVITNLVDNAVKFARGHVEIRLTRTDAEFLVRVWDDGSGITESHLAHLFDRGWTPELSARSEKQSSGLGLFIASSLTERCGGQLVVESEAINGGELNGHSTAFTLSLPLDNRPVGR
ncbi:MAG: HAMP domain-containing histidine kinase [Chloroflexi bacterium]|nr:HAMP domain-containing histidine kinase [Chloroflexota bacterium]MBT5476267.1 HAMP domain-containing histidine kinase [Chloroflexota bacterium]MBT5894216.1 HAMP domain-containing histidine kinase [Chloroflexota bacterium]